MSDLRQRLIDAQLARGNIYYTNEEKADDALAVVADWLRSEAAYDVLWFTVRTGPPGCSRWALERLADAIEKPTEGAQP